MFQRHTVLMSSSVGLASASHCSLACLATFDDQQTVIFLLSGGGRQQFRWKGNFFVLAVIWLSQSFPSHGPSLSSLACVFNNHSQCFVCLKPDNLKQFSSNERLELCGQCYTFVWIKVFLGYSLLPQQVIEEGVPPGPAPELQLRYKERLGGRESFLTRHGL